MRRVIDLVIHFFVICHLTMKSRIGRIAEKNSERCFEGTLTRMNRIIITCARVHFPHENNRIADS